MRDDNYNLIRYNESPLHNFGYTGARVWVCDACEFRKQVIEEQAEAGEFEEQAEAGEFNMYLSYIEQVLKCGSGQGVGLWDAVGMRLRNFVDWESARHAAGGGGGGWWSEGCRGE